MPIAKPPGPIEIDPNELANPERQAMREQFATRFQNAITTRLQQGDFGQIYTMTDNVVIVMMMAADIIGMVAATSGAGYEATAKLLHSALLDRTLKQRRPIELMTARAMANNPKAMN